jgi:hypothetical protein
MAGFSFDISDLSRLTGDLQKVADGIQKRERTAVNLAGNEYKADVQRIIAYDTGTLRRSVHVEPSTDNMRPVSLVGSNAPYARRIEYGFWDMQDSLGRRYFQRAQPAWRPAFYLNKNKYGRIMIDYLNGTNTASEEFVSGDY